MKLLNETLQGLQGLFFYEGYVIFTPPLHSSPLL